jgi:hypothetical protein
MSQQPPPPYPDGAASGSNSQTTRPPPARPRRTVGAIVWFLWIVGSPLPAPRKIRPVTAWTLEYDAYDPAEEGQWEALCTLVNGFFATRGAAPESRTDGVHNPGTYAAGCYNRLRDEIAGEVVENIAEITR